MDIATKRLIEERKQWRKDHPTGFVARPRVSADDTVNLKKWDCFIPGPKDTIWSGGHYKLSIEFKEGYPQVPPKCQFDRGFYHPNIYPSGTVCHSILDADQAWSPDLKLADVLLAIQNLLVEPNLESPAQFEAFHDLSE